MDPSIPTITEVRGMLLALQKNLECPICLEVMKEPVSTNCAHIFCRFCTLKLLRQKKGVTQCPLCNAKVTKRSLREDVRFKQVIKVVLDVIRAFEHDTGLKFSDDQCFPKKDTEATSVADSWKEQLVVDSKGYRGRLKRVKEGEEGNTILQGKSSNLPICRETNKRYSLRRKRRSSKVVVLEVGSDSSEDTHKKATMVKCVDLREEPQSYMGEECAENQNYCPMNLPGPSAEHEALTILGACSFSEARLESIECTPVVTENMKVAAENVAKLKNQGFSSPDPSMGQLDTKPETHSLQQDGSCSALSIPQAVAEGTYPTADKQKGDGTEWADIMMPAGSSQMIHVNEEQQPQTQVSDNSPLNPVTGKRLMQSIQKVSEWLSKSKEVIPPCSFEDIHSEQVNQDLNPCTLDADFCVSQKTGQIENQGEFTMWCEGDLPVAKPVASKLEDKIFGRTYRRERKSTPLRNDNNTIHIQAEESIAVNTNAFETPRKKTLARKRKATSELTPDDFIRRQDVKECRKRPVGVDCGSWEECVQTFADVDGSPVAHHKDAGFPEELSLKKTVGSEQAVSICHKLSESNLKKKPNSSSKKSRQLTRPHGPLQFVVGGNPRSPEQSKIQIEDREAKEGDTVQRQIRRSRRLQLLTEETWNGNKEVQLQPEGTGKQCEPAKRENKKEDEREKKPMSSQAENMPSVIENDSSTLQKGLPWSETTLMDMKDDADKVCPSSLVSPCMTGVVKGLSVEETKEGHSPYFIAPTVHSQGVCSLLQFHPTVLKQSTSDKNKGIVAGQFDKSALCVQTKEGSGSCTTIITESRSLPDDKAAGTVELNPETDDSEPDADFVQKIFNCSKRCSFLLHSDPAKESAAEIQRKLKVGKVEDGRGDCLEKLTQNEGRNEAVACVADKDITVQRLATSSSSFHELENTTEHLQLALEAPLPEKLSTPVQSLAKNREGGNQLQSQKPTTERRASPGIGENTSGSSRSLSGNGKSPSILRNCNIQGSSLSLVNETCSNRDHFQKSESMGAEHNGLALSTQPESIQPCPAICQPSLPQSSNVETKRSSIEQKQLNSDIEEAMDISSIGVPQCLVSSENLKQCTEEGPCVFELSSETPEGLLDPAIKSNEVPSNLEVDREDISVVPPKMDRPSLVGKDLGNNNSDNSVSKRKHFVLAHRKPLRKLPSSEEDESSEEEELPCFQALLFDTSSHALKNNKTSVEMLELQSSSRSHPSSKAKDVSPSQESECSVNLFSSQSHASEDSCNKACDTRHLTPVSGSVEKPTITIKNEDDIQPSGDASREDVHPKGESPRYVNSESNLGEECVGYDSEASHLGDSSGLSSQSEILTTQQRDAMQKDLKKLQHEMVIIEAALKQKNQHSAPKEWLQLDKEDDFTGEEMRSPKGSTMKLNSGSKQSFLGNSFSTVKSSHGTLGSHYIPSSNPEELFSCDLTTKTNRSPATKPGTFRRPLTPRHEAQRSLISPLTPIARSCSKTKNQLLNSKKNMSLVASGLNQDELRLVQRFVRKTESTWSNKMTEETTHVIMKTDEDRVCERTLKYFLGIAAQKWVVSYQWIEQSLQAERVLNEEDFEVRGDVINGRNHQGPKRSRESPPGKLFQGLEICCYGPFTDMLPEQLEWMVELCGASLVKQPHLFAHATNSSAVIIVQPDVWVEDAACQGLPPQCNATVVLREWVLDSVACYQRQPFDGYIIH